MFRIKNIPHSLFHWAQKILRLLNALLTVKSITMLQCSPSLTPPLSCIFRPHTDTFWPDVTESLFEEWLFLLLKFWILILEHSHSLFFSFPFRQKVSGSVTNFEGRESRKEICFIQTFKVWSKTLISQHERRTCISLGTHTYTGLRRALSRRTNLITNNNQQHQIAGGSQTCTETPLRHD